LLLLLLLVVATNLCKLILVPLLLLLFFMSLRLLLLLVLLAFRFSFTIRHLPSHLMLNTLTLFTIYHQCCCFCFFRCHSAFNMRVSRAIAVNPTMLLLL
jgi:hypothetical protein